MTILNLFLQVLSYLWNSHNIQKIITIWNTFSVQINIPRVDRLNDLIFYIGEAPVVYTPLIEP